MSTSPKIHPFKTLRGLATRLRSDLKDQDLVLLFAYNRTGKTRISMEFKEDGKRKNGGNSDTLYFNAFTEDLFNWENDFEGDTDRHLVINEKSKFFEALSDLALDETIYGYLKNYADFDFFIDYDTWKITFRKENAENIKISRGEENIFIWCLFMAICERMLDSHESYQWAKFLYIDDPVSSLDDNHAIAVACDLAKLLRRAASRKDSTGADDPIKVVFSSHHSLFFNVMCNELNHSPDGETKVKKVRYFLHRPNGDGEYRLQKTDDTPYFHHVATLAELQRAAVPVKGTLYTFHFNALRSIMEKTASFFGHSEISFCLKAIGEDGNDALYNRALNLLSHGKYEIHTPSEMGEDNKDLFRSILRDFLEEFHFDLPNIIGTNQTIATPVATTERP